MLVACIFMLPILYFLKSVLILGSSIYQYLILWLVNFIYYFKNLCCVQGH